MLLFDINKKLTVSANEIITIALQRQEESCCLVAYYVTYAVNMCAYVCVCVCVCVHVCTFVCSRLATKIFIGKLVATDECR